MDGLPREILVERAKLARKVEQPDAVICFIETIAKNHKILSLEERELFPYGCKNMVASRFCAMSALASTEQMDKELNADNAVLTEEIKMGCRNVINIAELLLRRFACSADENMFYHKMRGDCYMYLAQLEIGFEKNEAADRSLRAYKIALSAAKKNASPDNETMFGLFLNLSILYNEILELPDRAYQLMNFALVEANDKLESLKGDSFEKCTTIVQQMKDMLDQWTSRFDGDSDNSQNTIVKVGTLGKYEKTIKKIDAKIHEGKVRSVRKLSKSKIYLNGLSQKLESEKALEDP